MGISPFDPWIKAAVKRGLIAPDVVKAVARETVAKVAGKKRKTVATGGSPKWALTLYPACRVISEANSREHWAVANRRKKEQQAAVEAAWKASVAWFVRPDLFPLPLVVTLTHVGPEMDDDNLSRSFKGVRDCLAALIGIDDGDNRIQWVPRQTLGKPGIEIRIEGV